MVCGLGWGGGSGVACGHMCCRLVCVHAHAISPACVLVVCYHVLARYLHAARCWVVCVAMAGGSLSWCAGGLGEGGLGWAVGTCGAG